MRLIDQLVSDFSLMISDDLRDFLRVNSDGPRTSESLPSWPTGAASIARPTDDEIKDRESSVGYPNVARFIDLESFKEDLQDEDDDGHLYFWHREFLRFGVPFAYSSMGDPIIEASPDAGQWAGRIYLTSHDFYYEWYYALVVGEDLDELEEEFEGSGVDVAMVADLDIEGFFQIMTADIEIDGLFIELAPDFGSFYDNLCRLYGAG